MRIKRNKYLKKLTLAVLAGLTFNTNSAFAEEETIELPAQVMVTSFEEWVNRNLRIIGRGDTDILIYGGKQNGSVANASMDESSTFINFYGGYYDGINTNEAVDITGNVIDVSAGGIGWIVYDDPEKYNDSYNRVHIFGKNGNTLNINLIAGHSGLGEVYGNKINISGGTVTEIITPAESKVGTENFSARLHDNEVNIYGNPDLTLAKLYGATLFNDDTRERTPTFGTNNSLNIYTNNLSVEELTAFNNYNFYLPEDVQNNDTILKVTGALATDLSDSNIYAVLPVTANLDIDDTITLLNNNSGVLDNAGTSYVGVNGDTFTTKFYTISMESDIVVQRIDENNVTLSFTPTKLTPATKLIPEARVPTTINKVADFLSGDLATIEAAGAQIFTPFYAITNGSTTYKTGSHVTVRGANLIVGFSRKIDRPDRSTLIAPIFEYGRGNYDSYLDGGEHGQGHHRHFGGGIVFRTKLSDGKFYDGSFRIGRIKTDFESNSFGVAGRNVLETFETNSRYIGAHIGVGREVHFNRKEIFTYSAKFLFSHTGADIMALPTGEEYHLSSVNSERIKIGVREEYEADNHHNFYIGCGLEYEFTGNSYATYRGLRTETPSTKGLSGVFDFGWIIKPRGDEKFSLDLSGNASVGKNRGLTGRFGINWLF